MWAHDTNTGVVVGQVVTGVIRENKIPQGEQAEGKITQDRMLSTTDIQGKQPAETKKGQEANKWGYIAEGKCDG